MPAGISTAKARRNSKTKTKASRAKLGLPAKAGKRRPHNIMRDKDGNYVAAPFVARPREEYVETRGYSMGDVSPKHVVIKPKGAVLYEGLVHIRKMKYNQRNNSDPFLFDRMRTHFVHGLVEV